MTYTLKDVVNLDAAHDIYRVMRLPDADISVHATAEMIRGLRVWTATPRLRWPNDKGLRYDTFEVIGPRSQAQRVICRYVRDWANARARGEVW